MPKLNVKQNNGNVIKALQVALETGHRNLLDNPFFTIRQMGTGGVTGVGYAVDRWKNTGGANLTQTPRSPYGITFASSSGYQVDQALWDYPAEYLAGKTLTLSVMTNGGKVAQATGTFTATSSTAAKIYVVSADGNFALGLYYIPSSSAVPFIRVTTPSGKFPVNAPILAVKLELGSYSTLANDVPPNYAEELAKCQHYFVRIKGTASYNYLPVGFGAEQASGAIRMAIITPTSLRRASVTVSFSGTLNVSGNGTRTTVSSMSIIDVSDAAVLAAVVPAALPANTHTFTLSLAAGAYIDLSADL